MEILRKNINFEAIVKRAPRRRSSVAVSSVLVLSGLMPGGVHAEGITSHVNAQLSKDDTHTLVLYETHAESDPTVNLPSSAPVEFENPTLKETAPVVWQLDPEISFYGPGLYGRRTACGLELTKELKGVAHRDLPCGTEVAFEWEGIVRTFPVVDRGPYVDGRIFDLTGGACMAFVTKEHPEDRCFTGPINYAINNQSKKTN